MGQSGDSLEFGFQPTFQARLPGLSVERLNAVQAQEIERLRRAIVEHRTAITNAGTVKVQPGYEPVAEAKHRADERLWKVVGDA